ncbi:MAG TPA: hypothetical protein VGM32_08165 [Rhodopila sp.]
MPLNETNIYSNSFTITNGVVSAASYYAQAQFAIFNDSFDLGLSQANSMDNPDHSGVVVYGLINYLSSAAPTFTVEQVPEPAMPELLVFGLAMLAWLHSGRISLRRHKNRAFSYLGRVSNPDQTSQG